MDTAAPGDEALPAVAPQGRHRAAVLTAAVLTLVAAVAFGAGILVGRGSGGGAPHVEQLTASGPIGPWQHYGHASSSKRVFAAVAADPNGVLLIGDSVAARIRADLATALREQKRPMSWDHWNGRPTHGAADMLVALDAAGHQPQTLVVVSGENDVFEPYLFATQVERMMRTAGPNRHVYWVVPVVARPARTEPDMANSERLADTLTAAARSHPNLHLVDWRDFMATHDEAGRAMLMPDGVHPSPEGSLEMVRLVMQSLAGRTN
ncbi:MAG: GDSL-type esterase/lipase family protein [Dermatophilus congolensis]|nr:GDSL-type esterase/lipase family protein [Dermatophilus congolensis]